LGRKWIVIQTKAEKIKNLLLAEGGREEKVGSPYEIWRIKLKNATFTYYQTKTLYATLPKEDPTILAVFQEIDKIAGSIFIPLRKDFAIGLDETNKGEVIGPLFLIGLFLPKELFDSLEKIVALIDTKKVHDFSYWEKNYQKIIDFKKAGLTFIGKKIAPQLIDKYKINYLMDMGYLQILKRLVKEREAKNIRIVIDDYGVGKDFKNFLAQLAKAGAEIIIKKGADEKFLEVKIASIIAKYFKEAFFHKIKNDPKYQIENLTIGSGNLSDKETKEWLKKWYEKYQKFPYFVRISYAPIKKILGIEKKSEKLPN